MKPSKLIRATAVALSGAGLLLPQSAVLAATPAAPPAVQSSAPAALDVALAQGGLLQGQVVDAQGQPVVEAPVAVFYEGQQIAETTADESGQFSIQGLKSGPHVVVSGEHGGMCRMWAAETAPPAANSRVMIVKGSEIARGQGLSRRGTLLMIGVLGGIVAGGVIAQNDDGYSGS